MKNYPNRVRVRVTLRLAVYCQSVRLGAEPLDIHSQICFPQLNSCGQSPYITSSLTRGWVCHLQLLLALAGAFILESQIRDFPTSLVNSLSQQFYCCMK
jgi:hypothetical protein